MKTLYELAINQASWNPYSDSCSYYRDLITMAAEGLFSPNRPVYLAANDRDEMTKMIGPFIDTMAHLHISATVASRANQYGTGEVLSINREEFRHPSNVMDAILIPVGASEHTLRENLKQGIPVFLQKVELYWGGKCG